MSGEGLRFREAGYKDLKPLIEVDGRPMIYHVLDLFASATEQQEFICICNEEHLATTNMRQILESHPFHPKIISISPHKLGPVYAVSQIFSEIADHDEIIVSYCDYGTVWNYEGFLAEMRGSKAQGGIACYRGFHPHMLGTDNYAFVRINKSDPMVAEEIREKQPFTQNRMEEWASNGTYYFQSGALLKKYCIDLIEHRINKNGEYYMSLVYNLMIHDGQKVLVYPIQKMLQWGTPADLEIYKMWSDHFRKAVKGQKRAKSNATLLLPMAGAGSRFRMEGYDLPKPLLPVNGEPMVVRAVQSIPDCEKKVFLCLEEHLATFPLTQTLKSFFTSSKIIPIAGVTEGQACTCEIGIHQAGVASDEPILISACDNGVDYDANAYEALEKEADVIVWAFTNNPTSRRVPHMYAWLDIDEKNNIRYVSVKKELPGANHCIIGTMYFRSASLYLQGLQTIYEKNIRTNGEFYVDNLLNPLIEAGYKVKVFPVEAYTCWGTPADYKTYNYWLEHFTNVWGMPAES